MKKPYQMIILLFIYLSQTLAVKEPLNSFIRHHERLSYDLSDVHRRTRRAFEISPFANVHIQFAAFGLNLTLHLKRTYEIFSEGFKIVDGHGNPIDYDYSRFFNGEVEGFDRRSHCLGKIDNGRFEGSIHVGNDEFHIDPAERYYGNDENRHFHSVIYRVSDVEHSASVATPELPARPTTFKGSSKPKKENFEDGKIRYRRGPKNQKMNTCDLKLVADHLFMKKFVRRETAIDQMVLHYQAVEFIFRNETFNTTDEYDSTFSPQGIGFRIKEIHVLFEDTVPEPIKKEHMSIYHLLELFSRMDHSSACLSYLFTDRSFDNGVLGLAWIAYPYGQAGGICDPYADYGGTMKSYNTGLISFKLYNREAPRAVTEITFAHELGHSFGAQHDPDSKECQPSTGGKYIMYDKATPGYEPNNRRFSKCSIGRMVPVINAKGLEITEGCFTDRKFAICGNGVHELGEICDCGTVSTCREKCCTPFGSKEGQACTLRNPAYECSPSRGPCCLNDTCTIAREFLKCFDGTECQESRVCNGLRVECPLARNKPNHTLCDKDRSVCINGFCQGSLCLRYGMEGCLCEEPENKCKTCCRNGNKCSPSGGDPEMPNMTLTRGTPCNYYKGYCNSLGICEDIDMNGPLRMLYYTFFTEEGIKIWFARYWFVLILGSFLILCMLAAFVYYCQHFTPSDNPALNERKPHKPLRKRKTVVGGYQAAYRMQPMQPMQQVQGPNSYL